MTVELLARRIEREGDSAAQLWKLLAWLGRYGHQNMLQWLDVPISDLRSAVSALRDLLDEEKVLAEAGKD